MPNMRIESDGTPGHTHVYDQDGKEIRGIIAIEWTMHDCERLATARLTIEDVSIQTWAKGEA